MDANGSRFWSLQAAAHWPTLGQGVDHVRWHAACSALCLASERELEAPADAAASRSAALLALSEVPRALDAQGVVCSWHAPSQAIVVRSAHLPEAAIALPLDAVPTDLCVASDGVLYVALPGRVLMHDLRRRWAAVSVTEPGFSPWRLAAHPEGGVWALELGTGRLARLKGHPLPSQTPPSDAYAPGVFRPDPENCRVPAMTVVNAGWSGVAEPLALACHAQGGLLLMGWNSEGQTWVRRWDEASHTPGPMRLLRGALHAYALTWLKSDRIALRMPGRVDAPAFAIDNSTDGELPALGEVFPLASDRREAPFVHRPEGVAHYPVRDDAAEPLFALALPNLARSGTAASFITEAGQLRAQLIDSGTPATTWHRVFMEASIPPACGVVVWLAATNDPQPPAPERLDAWHPHAFGRDVRGIDPAASGPHVPHAVWEPAPSELPAHPGLAPWTPQRGLRGLFSVLVQNARTAVRSLSGRYLWVRLSLHGDGRASPEVVALRAWASRFNYAEQYLPRIYRETLFGDVAQQPGERLDSIDEGHAAGLDIGGEPDVALLLRLATGGIDVSDGAQVVVEHPGRSWLLKDGGSARCWRLLLEGHAIGVYRPQASPADFLARSLANMEGVLTQLEDRVAHAHLLTDPASTPADHLDWLASWVGLSLDAALPAARRRAWLQAAPELARWHGTRRGLALALDVATGGGVSGGEVVVLEDFRLRRLLATLLGVDLADEDDPLLPGLQVSGNSVVGDTLVLGDQARVELMALYREEATTAQEDQAIADFYGRLAHRATVLVHREVDEVDLGLIRRIVALEAPAHVQVRVTTASWPFMVGVASLVGVDTYLARAVPPRPVRVQRSVLGGGDFVLGPTTLDPRLRGEAAPPPVVAVQPLSTPRSLPTQRRAKRPRKE
jgi:phage tail-like protein